MRWVEVNDARKVRGGTVIVAVASGKGGTGKTTVAVSLALSLAPDARRGRTPGFSRETPAEPASANPVHPSVNPAHPLFLDCDVEEPNAALFLNPTIMMKDNRSSSQAPPGRATGIERWGWYSIAVNVVLAAINLGIALASGSLAVEAEMVHNLVDLLSAIGVLIGLRLSTRKSKEFPYGLYKLENLVAVVLAVMTFITAYEIARDALLETARRATVNA